MSILAVIPARGGSKRIPKKNIKYFFGKPMIVYSINTAISSHLFDQVMVSTDSEDIAEIATKHGAIVPFMRSEDAADDYATTTDVLIEVIAEYENRGIKFDYVCCLYPTSPFTTPDLLVNAFKRLKEHNLDCVLPLEKYSYPIQRAVTIGDKKVSWINPENEFKRSQDLQDSYHDAGQFYFLKVDVFKQKKQLITDNTGYILVDSKFSQDIDNESDWQLAELKYSLFNKK